ncbi:MAG: PKD domain-containing protein [Desulfosudis oleivorans]|nr:PKD domain-containing protein [Desulfosudis oleivorans]
MAKAGDDITVDQHTLVQFNGSRSTDLTVELNYTWMIGDVSTIKLYGPVPTFTFHEAGSFEVLLLVNDSSGNIGKDMMMVTVLDTTSPRTIGLNDRLVPQCSSIYLDASGV